MDKDVVKAFNAELSSIYNSKPPLSKHKIEDISKAALKAKTYYKHVVFSVEKFLSKCKVEYKIPCLYVIDSIIRASKRQFKEKDVYGPRFLKNFSKTLNDLLQCATNDQLRVVRTLNLWLTGDVFTEEEMAPIRDQCRSLGLETDVEAVERAVKGSKANMSIYGKNYQIRGKPEFEATTPPGYPPVQIAKEEPSDEIPEGGISERQLLNIMIAGGVDFGGTFSTDLGLLRKAHVLVNSELQKREELHKQQHSHNIKKMLRMDFDYSDEEDGDGEQAKEEIPEPPPFTIEDKLRLANEFVRDPNVMNALKTMQQEFVSKLNQVAAAAISQQRSSESQHAQATPIPPSTGSGTPAPLHNVQEIAAALAARGLQVPVSMPPGGVPVSGVPGAAALQGLPALQLPPGQLQALAGLQGLQGLQMQGIPLPGQSGAPNTALIPNLGMLPVTMQSLLAQAQAAQSQSHSQPGFPAGLLQQQQELLKQLGQGAQLNPGLLGVPPPGGMPLMPMGVPAHVLPQRGAGEDLDMNDAPDERRRKRSRSRDRGEKRRRSRSRDREKDRDRKEKDRERRKLGLPYVEPGTAFIASRTLWFGRLPQGCAETDLKSAIGDIGEVVRVFMVTAKACAYVTMDTRRNAQDVFNKLEKVELKGRQIKVNWAISKGQKELQQRGLGSWDEPRGLYRIPWEQLPGDLERFCDGGYLDLTSLPPERLGIYTDTGAIAVAPPVQVPPPGPADDTMDMSSPHEASPSDDHLHQQQQRFQFDQSQNAALFEAQQAHAAVLAQAHAAAAQHHAHAQAAQQLNFPHQGPPPHGAPRGHHMSFPSPAASAGMHPDFRSPPGPGGSSFRGRGGFRGDRGGFGGRGGFNGRGFGRGGFRGNNHGNFGDRGGGEQPFNRFHDRPERGDDRDRRTWGRDREFPRDRDGPDRERRSRWGDRDRNEDFRGDRRRDDERFDNRDRERRRPRWDREENGHGNPVSDDRDRRDRGDRRRDNERSRERDRSPRREREMSPLVEQTVDAPVDTDHNRNRNEENDFVPLSPQRHNSTDARPTPDAGLVSSTTEDQDNMVTSYHEAEPHPIALRSSPEPGPYSIPDAEPNFEELKQPLSVPREEPCTAASPEPHVPEDRHDVEVDAAQE